MKRFYIYFLFFSFPIIHFSQNSKEYSQLSVFLDTYYVFDFNNNNQNSHLPFLYNHNRNRELNVNLGLIKYQYKSEIIRANFAIHAGTYVSDNYSSEQEGIKNIAEANLGIALNSSKSTWIDVGILPSHIGFESAISMDNLTLTRSILAENSPYFMAGVKINYQLNNKFEVAGMVLNGWQRIKKVDGNSMPSFGTQLRYKMTENSILNWSTFIGTDDPDIDRRMRYFNNLYAQIQWNNQWNSIANIDFGCQQKSKNSSIYNHWFCLAMIHQFKYSEKTNFNLRIESFKDANKIIIPSEKLNGWNIVGCSIGVDYFPIQNMVWRNEIRMLQNQDSYFSTQNLSSKNDVYFTSSLSFKF